MAIACISPAQDIGIITHLDALEDQFLLSMNLRASLKGLSRINFIQFGPPDFPAWQTILTGRLHRQNWKTAQGR